MKKIAKQVNGSTEKKVLDFVRKCGILRPQDLLKKGLPSDYLWRLHKQGKLEKVARGMYAIQGAKVSEYQTVVQAALRVPHGVVCLLSALRFHNFTTQSTFEIWIAIDVKERRSIFQHCLIFQLPILGVTQAKVWLRRSLKQWSNSECSNTRMKDFFDVWTVSRQFAFDGPTLSRALKTTFETRGTAIPNKPPSALSREFYDDREKNAQWKAFLNKAKLDTQGKSLPEIAEALRAFLLPVSEAAALDEILKQNWKPGGSWVAFD